MNRKIRILYVLDRFPTLSESYIRTELEFVLSQGDIEIFIVSEKHPDVGYPISWDVAYGSAGSAAAAWKPDVIHVHWLNVAGRAVDLGVPVTVRGHSFEFSSGVVDRLRVHPSVRRIFLFPHQIERCNLPSTKLTPMTAAYNPARYYPGGPKRAMTLRIGAGLHGKGIEEFIRIAAIHRARHPSECRFVLVITAADPSYDNILTNLNYSLGGPVEILHNVSHERCAELIREASVCLRGHDPQSHVYGMPVSIAEAMASGCTVVAREAPEARAYAGSASLFYSSEEEAAEKVQQALSTVPNAAAISWAQQFRSDRVLPPLVEEWRRIVS